MHEPYCHLRCGHGGLAERHRHLRLHGHRGLDGAPQGARGRVRGRPVRTPANRSRDVHPAEGVEIDTQGDAFFFAFARARDAVEAAVEAQRAHASPAGRATRPSACAWASTPASRRLAARGTRARRRARRAHLHCGQGRQRPPLGDDAVARRVVAAGRRLRLPLGRRHLKDIDQPEQVYELAIDGVETTTEVEPAPAGGPPEPSSVTACGRRFRSESTASSARRSVRPRRRRASPTTQPLTSSPGARPISASESQLGSTPRCAPKGSRETKVTAARGEGPALRRCRSLAGPGEACHPRLSRRLRKGDAIMHKRLPAWLAAGAFAVANDRLFDEWGRPFRDDTVIGGVIDASGANVGFNASSDPNGENPSGHITTTIPFSGTTGDPLQLRIDVTCVAVAGEFRRRRRGHRRVVGERHLRGLQSRRRLQGHRASGRRGRCRRAVPWRTGAASCPAFVALAAGAEPIQNGNVTASNEAT